MQGISSISPAHQRRNVADQNGPANHDSCRSDRSQDHQALRTTFYSHEPTHMPSQNVGTANTATRTQHPPDEIRSMGIMVGTSSFPVLYYTTSRHLWP